MSNSPKIYSNSKKIQDANTKFKLLHKRYADVFEYLVYSVINIADISFCTITLYSEENAFVIATNAQPTRKIWPLTFSDNEEKNKELVQRIQTLPIHNDHANEISLHESFPITHPEGRIVGSLQVLDTKVKKLNPQQLTCLQNTVAQVDRWVKVKEKEQRLINHDNLIELTDDLIGVFSSEGIFIKINPAFTKVLGWSEKELKSTNLLNFVHAEDQANTLKVLKNLERGIPIHS